jgi:gluconate 5-dehydrogenase
MSLSVFSLAGKVAVVTGASRGIGHSLAAAIAAAGAHVALLGRDETTLTAATTQLTAAGSQAIPVVADVSDIAAIGPALEQVVSRFCAQRAAELMTEGGCIVNVCSLTSEVGVPGAAPYGASKSGLAGLTRALATEWAPRGIRVNGIGPGYFRTALTESFYEDAQWQEAMLSKIPMRRFGQLPDLAGAAVFLCSDAASYITGQVLYIDGGYLAAI